MSNTDGFFARVGAHMGAEFSPATLALLNFWSRYEGTTARYNPLATTTPQGNSSRYNGIGVQNFQSPDDGALATARTLMNGHYPALRSALVRNADVEAFRDPEIVAEVRVWGTSGFANVLASGEAVDLADDYNAPSFPPGSAPPAAPAPEPAPAPAPEPAPGPAPEPAPGPGVYTVVPGDSLSEIAARQLGNEARWPEILDLNRAEIAAVAGEHGEPADGSFIVPGMRLRLPEGSAPNPAPQSHPAPREYTVVPGDSLSEIAARQLGNEARWEEIYALNRAEIGGDPNLIHPGQVLTLPE